MDTDHLILYWLCMVPGSLLVIGAELLIIMFLHGIFGFIMFGGK